MAVLDTPISRKRRISSSLPSSRRMRSTGSWKVALTTGWRLKTDAAEQPDPAQSDRLAELHRWLDARSRSIRLADLLSMSRTTSGSASTSSSPARKRVDPGKVCALLAALAHGCNLGLYTMEKVAPRHRLQAAQVRQRFSPASSTGRPGRSHGWPPRRTSRSTPILLRHVSPIEWKNVILYGEIKIDPAKLKMRRP